MLRVIGQVIAGIRMREDGERPAIERQPLRNLAKAVGGHRQLAAATWMWANWAQMVMALKHAELRAGSSA